MKLIAPSLVPSVSLVDIEGHRIEIGKGRRMLLSLFREATCPFCNFRVYELTHNYRAFSSLGLDMVAVFHSTREDVLKFIARQPRPFRMVADPEAKAHETFGVQKSFLGKLRAMLLRMPAMLRGLRLTRMQGMRTGNLMPADFLIDENGKVVETYYGKDAGDHIPIERVELFTARGIASRVVAA